MRPYTAGICARFVCMRIALLLEYDGRNFCGSQYQVGVRTVQAELESALATLCRGPVTAVFSGRTDTGVHALGQVAHFDWPEAEVDLWRLAWSLNGILKEDVCVRALQIVDDTFHARFSASSKTYRYQIRNAPTASPFDRAYVWHIPERLSLPAMSDAAARLVGTHDFAAFRSVGGEISGTVRTITRSECLLMNGLLAYEVTGTGFLRHMVRAIVGTLVEIGRGWRTPEDVTVLLQGGTRAQAGATAPPHGLCLVEVRYD